MMKAIKGFVVALVAAIMCAGFAACGGKSVDKKDLVGEWKNRELDIRYKFKENGKVSGRNSNGHASGTYTLSGNTLTVTTNKYGEEEFTISISGDKLMIEDSEGNEVELTRD